MRRGLWFVAGAGAGVVAVRRLQRLAEAFTADGVRDRVHGAGAAARIFREEAAAGRAAKENELRERLALVPPEGAVPQLDRARSTEQKGSS